ncbi:serine/threonine protein kinase [Microbacterium sp. M28]|uniref:serine/threonine-protein kinase n=1 Tax=Microbacterium sp. M28 TaxID=2962064 RepID=UPI0021F440ED|nr:serine/threonine-protein kinase [Microbacterium sp. M28]UYO96913.1 serine/threonine protein kinase [Microbacterium sp. M28]
MTLEVVSPTSALLDGRYLLEDRVGKGGMATVYRAEDTHLGRTVAIKMIHDGGDAVSSVDRAHTEKALLASMNHPSLVTLYDAQLEPGRPQYLVMEFVDGPTLAARMAEGPLPPRQLAHLMQNLAEGLAAAHAAGIIHRDVKPSNVLLARTGDAAVPWTAKLADFGIACSIDRSPMTSPGIVLGTLAYMAPEQLRDADPGTAVDIFSLGLVVLEALTGRIGYPELGSGRAAALARVMQPPTIAETVDDEWRDLLERMTRLEPDERPTAAEVAAAAKELARSSSLDPLPVAPEPGRTPALAPAETARTAVLPATAASHPSRRRAVIAGAALAAATLATSAAFLLPPADGPGRVVPSTTLRTLIEPAQTDTTSNTDGDAPEAPNESDDTGNQGTGQQGNSEKNDKGNSDKGQGKGKDGSDQGKGNGKG